VYPLFHDDPRYLDILGNPGSNPLELFWDVVDSLDQQLDAKVGIIESVIARHNARIAESKDDETPFSITAETTWEQFVGVVSADVSVKTLENRDLHLVFTTVGFFDNFGCQLKLTFFVLAT